MENMWENVHLSSLNQDPTIKIPQNEKYPHEKNRQDQSTKDVLSTPVFMSSLNTPFEALGFSASSSASSSSTRSLFNCFASKNKRVAEDQGNNNEDSCVDRRYKRMMKNRESAARSRARRQAYTSELEREIAELLEDNEKLKKEQLELMLSSPAGIPKKSTHARSLTAPF